MLLKEELLFFTLASHWHLSACLSTTRRVESFHHTLSGRNLLPPLPSPSPQAPTCLHYLVEAEPEGWGQGRGGFEVVFIVLTVTVVAIINDLFCSYYAAYYS